MPLVYRIEHKDTHCGPFQAAGLTTQWMARQLSAAPAQFPTPDEDGLPLASLPPNWAFGCLSLKELARWILLEEDRASHALNLRHLEAILGFEINEYQVSDSEMRVGASGTQVSFDADRCRADGRVKRLAIHSLLEFSRSPADPGLPGWPSSR